MQTAIRRTSRNTATLPVVALFLTTILQPGRASAQSDPSIQAAQQANQQAIQAAQQANQQAMQAAQQANQQAMQDMQNAAAQSSSSSTPQYPIAPPNLNTPVPAQVRAAHSIFFANDGAAPNFPYDPDATYSAVYSALQAWGHYQIAPSAQQADLIFQIHGAAPITDISGTNGNVYTGTTPALQLYILDPHTNIRLWTVTSPVLVAPKRATAAHWQQVSVDNLVSRIKVLAGQSLSPSETASLTTYPNYHRGRTIAILAGGFVAVGVGGGLLLHHEFENSLANQKASQDAFCKANNIPASLCAGG